MKLLAIIILLLTLIGGPLYLLLSRLNRAIERDFDSRFKP